MDKGEDRPIQ
ncbi:hypothetical protein LINGRAHAP2_LOCUS27790 [Linum grandiflorum]